MTVLDDRQVAEWAAVCGARPRPNLPAARRRPVPARPEVAPLRYRGNGVRMSQAVHVHTRRPVSTALSLALAAVAGLITLWLGFLANVSGERGSVPAQQPDRLAVVQVQAGETLHQLAGRVAPDVPAGRVVERIRELNNLDSAAVDAGQTLIAPLG